MAAVKDIYLQKLKKLPLQPPLFSCLKFVSYWIRCAVNILEDFTDENSRKSPKKPQKQHKTRLDGKGNGDRDCDRNQVRDGHKGRDCDLDHDF